LNYTIYFEYENHFPTTHKPSLHYKVNQEVIMPQITPKLSPVPVEVRLALRQV